MKENYFSVCDTGPGTFSVSGPRSLPQSQRPRERLIKFGAESLSDRDLLSILLNTGVKGKNVSILAEELLDRLEQDKEIPPVTELVRLTGLGESKASAVAAMLEFGRRRWAMTGIKISSPADIFTTVRHYADRRQERFICLSLNGAHEVLAVRVVTLGLVNRTIVHPREVFADPISDRSCAICVAHNHPSGELTPSPEDDEVTQTLWKAAKILGIRFLDHIIFSTTAYFSYSQTGRMPREREMIPT
ncbi:MAG: DNA repair protein RadC [Spirochaetaceae bacterium]|jgi:DNA repair protein RadC|nr:DNA repair protein RadC [Spirochaetaceae bacterium]